MPNTLAPTEDLTKQYLADIMLRTSWTPEFACRQLSIELPRFRQLSAGRKDPATHGEWSSIRTLREDVLSGNFRPDPAVPPPVVEAPAVPEPTTAPTAEQPPVAPQAATVTPIRPTTDTTARRTRGTRQESPPSPRQLAEFHRVVFEACGGDAETRRLDSAKVVQIAGLLRKNRETVMRWALGSQHPKKYKMLEVRQKILEFMGQAVTPEPVEETTPEVEPVSVTEMLPPVPETPVVVERAAPTQGPTTSTILNHVYDRLGKIGEFNPSTVAAAVALAFQKARLLKMDLSAAEEDVTR